MTKKSSFGNKLLFQVLSVTVLAFALTIFFVSKYSYETSEDDAKAYIEELAGKYASQIQTDVNQSVTIAEILASKYQAALSSQYPLKEQEVIDFATLVLEKNPFIIGIWFKIKEKELFFKANDDKKGVAPYDKTGQFNPYIAKAGGKVTIDSGSPYGENLEWVKGPKDSGKMYITKPYMYPVDGVDVLMSTVAVPLYKDGNFIGSIGIDISMDTFSKMAKEIKVYDNGYAFIADHHSYVIGHPNEKFVGKFVPDLTNNSQQHNELLANTREGKDTLFYRDSLKDNISSLYFSKAFKIGQDNIYWSFVLVAPVDEYLSHATFIRNFAILAGFGGLAIIALVIIFSIRRLNLNLESISTGLNDFFEYLNKKSTNPKQIEVRSNDEFGVMANSINENVKTIREGIDKDNALIDEVKDIVNSVAGGFLDKRIDRSTSTESLNELKTLLNDMLNNLEAQVGKDLNKISNILSTYSNRDFTAKLDEATSGKIGNEIIKMNNMITQMLTDNKRDGLSLQNSSNELTSNVRTLSNNATSQASSLEEKAASIDEITSNIEQTSQKAQEMLNISNDTKNSATEGKDLANQTVKAMEEINDTVFAINDAISVIDQIAFQTNILSLNAAVEAATAGEAGKGFAVVAAEVRNLASRSAEAAKEIKELVESATVKANSGKNISSSMIEGFSQLEEKIVDTSKLIDDVTNAAKEQSIGMTQIADAVGQLDQFTQENASIADKTNTIAQGTNTIAQEVVASVDKNSFDGKDSIKAQVQEHHEPVKKQTFVKKTVAPKKVAKKEVIKEEKDHDEWESF